jgi:hypothetical protein
MPRASAALELDPSHQQALGHALQQGLRFGREIVATNGLLGYFMASPFDAALYDAKLWLWEGLLQGAVCLLLFWRLARRGSFVDLALGALLLIVLPVSEDAWLFAIGLLAADLGIEALGALSTARSRWFVTWRAVIALALFAILALIKVGSLSFAIAAVAILTVYTAAQRGSRAALCWFVAWAGALIALWLLCGQQLQDLWAYFHGSFALAAGFDAAMSQPASAGALLMCALCLAAVGVLCVQYVREQGGSARGKRLDAAPAQALLVIVALLLAYKAGFSRASDHTAIFFGTALIAPLFLLPATPSSAQRSAWSRARWRCAVSLLVAVCVLATAPAQARTPRALAGAWAHRARQSIAWFGHPWLVRESLERSRANLQQRFGLPRSAAIIAGSSVDVMGGGEGLALLADLRWRPRPVFAGFSVFTVDAAQRNARWLASRDGPAYVLLRVGTIDRRLASSEDPLAIAVLLRDFRLRANERGLLLFERTAPRDLPARVLSDEGFATWGERIELPRGTDPLVIQAEVSASLWGRARAALYQTPEVKIEIDFEDGGTESYRVAPSALAAGVVLRPWLPTPEAWIASARHQPGRSVVGLRLRTAKETSFSARFRYRVERAEELRTPKLEPAIVRKLVLGAVGDMPQHLNSRSEPELVSWQDTPTMLLVRAPARLRFEAPVGGAQLEAQLRVPPWIAASAEFSGVSVRVIARENGASRECARLDLGAEFRDERAAAVQIRAQANFAVAGDFVVEITAARGSDAGAAAVGISALRVSTVP